MTDTLTAARLRELLAYNPETGIFTWLVSCGRRGAGTVTGSALHDRGYLRIGIKGRRYFAHRLAFLYMTGEWPPAQIDHINGRRDDNRWTNLRAATQSENFANSGPRSRNRLGLRGVSFRMDKGRYQAQICHNKQIHLGYYATPEEAAAVYHDAARRLFGKFAKV